MNVLITSASRKVGLVRAFQRALLDTGGGSVIAADVSPLSAALYVADLGLLIPRSDDSGFVVALLDLAAEHHIDLVIPTRDEELPVFAAHADEFLDRGVRVAVSPSRVIEVCQDKLAFDLFCKHHGLPVPAMYQDGGSILFPAFAKPRRGKGGAGARAVHSAEELRVALIQLGRDAIIQELVDAPEFTIDAFADFDANLVSVVPRRRTQVVAGESYVSQVELRPELIEAARRLSQALRFTGHVTIQCFAADRAVLLIEVNPRFGGAAALGWAAGAPTPHFLVQLTRGQALSPPGPLRDGLTMLRFTDDLFLRPNELAATRVT